MKKTINLQKVVFLDRDGVINRDSPAYIKSWDEFEDIVTDVAKVKWKNPNVTRYGRSGQRQNGIDILGDPFYISNGYAGIQCKNFDKELTLKHINEEIQKAESFNPSIQEYIFAFTDKRDVKVQAELMELSIERK